MHGVNEPIPPFGGPSFHIRVGKSFQRLIPDPQDNWGYPRPGPQSPTAAGVMTDNYFVSEAQWVKILQEVDYDFIVIGSGCTALAFIHETISRDPTKKILCLERGEFWLPSHFQNLPLPFKMTLGGPSETFPFTLSEVTFDNPMLRYCHGSCPFFGGRSTFWSAWSPQPRVDDMRDFPPEMIDQTKAPGFWDDAKKLLNVTSAADIDDTIFAGLQTEIDNRLVMPLEKYIPTADLSEPAQLSVGRRSPTSTIRFNKFSVPGPLLGLYQDQKDRVKNGTGKPFDIKLNCVVKRLVADNGFVHTIETSLGKVTLRNPEKQRVIICAGAFPAATILQNSFPSAVKTAGVRVTAHFLTHIVARVPISEFGPWENDLSKNKETKQGGTGLEIAAHYLAGRSKSSSQQYHVQITAIHSPDPKSDAVDAARECPDYAAAATEAQLKGSEDYVVFVCATLGEFTENNPENYFKPNPADPEPTTNSKLQFTLTKSDLALWDDMDEATYQTIETMSTPNKTPAPSLEYWNMKDANTGYWAKTKPKQQDIRIPGIVHEAGTAFVGKEEQGGTCDAYGRPHRIQNTHVTGGALFPTSGSWNPTMTMCGFAISLAKNLSPAKKQ